MAGRLSQRVRLKGFRNGSDSRIRRRVASRNAAGSSGTGPWLFGMMTETRPGALSVDSLLSCHRAWP